MSDENIKEQENQSLDTDNPTYPESAANTRLHDKVAEDAQGTVDAVGKSEEASDTEQADPIGAPLDNEKKTPVPQIEEKPQKNDQGATKKKGIIIAIVAVIVLAIAGIAAWSIMKSNSPYDDSAVEGYYKGKSEEQIQEELNKKLEEGMMNVSMKMSLYATPGQTDDIEIRWENIAANTMDQSLKIYPADDETDILYESKLIAPGQYIQYADFAHGFEAGTYTLVGMMSGYDRETHQLIGNAGVEVTLYVS